MPRLLEPRHSCFAWKAAVLREILRGGCRRRTSRSFGACEHRSRPHAGCHAIDQLESPPRRICDPARRVGGARRGGGAAAAIETDTIDGFWQETWWALSLMMTVGFVGPEPLTTAGKVISAVLMVTGFALLATVTATIASIFVREEERPEERTLQTLEKRVLAEVREVNERLRRLEERLDERGGQESTPHRR